MSIKSTRSHNEKPERNQKVHRQVKRRNQLSQEIRKRSTALAKKRYCEIMQNLINKQNMHVSNLEDSKMHHDALNRTSNLHGMKKGVDLNSFQFVSTLGARHCTPCFDDLYDVQPCIEQIIHVPNSPPIYANKEGKLLVEFISDQGLPCRVELIKVLFAPDLPNRIFSTQSFVKRQGFSVESSHDAVILKFDKPHTFIIAMDVNRRQTFHTGMYLRKLGSAQHYPLIKDGKVDEKCSEVKEDATVMSMDKDVNMEVDEESRSKASNIGDSLVPQSRMNQKLSVQQTDPSRKLATPGPPPYKRISSTIEANGETSFAQRNLQISSKTDENHVKTGVKSKSSSASVYVSTNKQRNNYTESLQGQSPPSRTIKRKKLRTPMTQTTHFSDLDNSTVKTRKALRPGWLKIMSEVRGIPYYVNIKTNVKYWKAEDMWNHVDE